MQDSPLPRLFDGSFDDERGVSEVIGSILVFGLLIAMLAIVQTQAVPNTNAGVEQEHDIRVRNDMTRLTESISATAATGSSSSVGVELGTGYPARLVLFNPPSVTGQLRTTSPSSPATVENAIAVDDEIRDYLGGSPATFETGSLVYRANYNRYDNAPEMVYESSVLANKFDSPDTTVVKKRGRVVSGQRISLVFLEEGYSEAGVAAASVDPQARSAPARTVIVQGDVPNSNRLQVTIPTELSAETWVQKVLVDQIDDPAGTRVGPDPGQDCDDLSASSSDPGNERFVVDCEHTGDAITLLFELEDSSGNPFQYQLQMSKVEFGSVDEPDAHYIVDIEGDGTNIQPGGAQRLIVEVRDEHNNPVSGVDVTPSLSFSAGAPPGTLTPVGTTTTDENGRVTFEYTAPSQSGTATIDVDVDGGTTGPPGTETVEFVVGVGGGTGAPPSISSVTTNYDDEFTVCTAFDTDTISIGGVTQTILTGCADSRNVEQASIDYSVSDSDGNLESVEIQLLDGGTGTVVASATHAVSGGSASGTWVSPLIPDASGDPSHVRVIVTDEAGNTVVARQSL